MPTLMAMTLTEEQILARTKTCTRRTNWKHVTPGTRLTLCRKVRGRRPGEPLVRLCDVEVTSVRFEPLEAITAQDCAREGFPAMSPAQFVAFFCATHKGCTPHTEVTRIGWRYLDDQPTQPAGGQR